MNYILSNIGMLFSLTANGGESTVISGIVESKSHTFRILRLRNLEAGAFYSILDLPPQLFKNLEALDVQLTSVGNPPPTTTSSTLATAPNLRKVSYAGPPAHIPQLLLLPWNQLTEISIASMELSAPIVHTTLQHCPNITYCNFTLSAEEIVPIMGSITLSVLKLLQLKAVANIDWITFFQ